MGPWPLQILQKKKSRCKSVFSSSTDEPVANNLYLMCSWMSIGSGKCSGEQEAHPHRGMHLERRRLILFWKWGRQWEIDHSLSGKLNGSYVLYLSRSLLRNPIVHLSRTRGVQRWNISVWFHGLFGGAIRMSMCVHRAGWCCSRLYLRCPDGSWSSMWLAVSMHACRVSITIHSHQVAFIFQARLLWLDVT